MAFGGDPVNGGRVRTRRTACPARGARAATTVRASATGSRPARCLSGGPGGEHGGRTPVGTALVRPVAARGGALPVPPSATGGDDMSSVGTATGGRTRAAWARPPATAPGGGGANGPRHGSGLVAVTTRAARGGGPDENHAPATPRVDDANGVGADAAVRAPTIAPPGGAAHRRQRAVAA
ncbi:hypothetical protein AB0A77_20690 [Streptomyces varsoviensis]|uniref:hypothetical protein n=1 Tax=Streptomyces varsoviensis TaxID=67373 RepID=UPI0033CFC3F5